ncbi:Crp/Fnr family transcriptional regulator [Roseomonas sp. AR75]|uniref:Crp/Fnr family transcriptional regulator n=1 Tax=Roseomonas sp. AR75 TaxID=2562311 RepID=UPI0010C13B33|nr:cyclic nucleotide-binding domain-containing protein [Roseomonas sp. AR75]
MSFAPLDLLVHGSNILLLIAYSVRDMLWLRWFAVAAAVTNMPFFLLQETVLWPPVMWAAVFTAINLVQIWRIYNERRPIVLGADEQALYDLGFAGIRPREFLALTMEGQWSDAPAGTQLLTAGLPAQDVCIAIRGRVAMARNGEPIGVLEPGDLIGVTMVLTGEPSPVDARFTEPGRYICWPTGRLRAFLEPRPELRAAVLGHVKQDVARKLHAAFSR